MNVHDPLTPHVAGLRAGDAVAFAAVWDETSSLLASIANGMVGNHQLAEDVVQDAYVKLAQHAPDFRGQDGRALRAWLVRTVRNRCIDVRRSAASRLERTSDEVPEVDSAPPADAGLDADLSPELARALRQLTDDQRTALVLSHVGGFSGAEVGEVLGRNRAAAYALVRRAERAIRAELGVPVQ